MELNFWFWLGIFLLSLSVFRIGQNPFRKKAVLKAPRGFIPLKELIHQLPDRLKTYEQMDWASVGVSQEEHYIGQLLYALGHRELTLYSATWLGQEKIPSDQLPPYERHTWGADYDRIDDESKKPLYTDLSIKKDAFEKWLKKYNL